MTLALQAATLLALLTVVVVVRPPRRARGFAGELVGRTTIAHTRDAGSIKGVVTAVHRDCLVISHPEFLQGAQPAGLGGEVVVDRRDVAWLQRVGEA